jgi:hypothetical protein
VLIRKDSSAVRIAVKRGQEFVQLLWDERRMDDPHVRLVPIEVHAKAAAKFEMSYRTMLEGLECEHLSGLDGGMFLGFPLQLLHDLGVPMKALFGLEDARADVIVHRLILCKGRRL